MQTNRLLGSCHSKAHSDEMRSSRGQLSASRLNKCNDDVSSNRVIIQYVKRRETTQAVSHCGCFWCWSGAQRWQDSGAETAPGGVNLVVSVALMCFDVEV